MSPSRRGWRRRPRRRRLTALYRDDDEATAPPPPEAVDDLRDELAETERRLVRAVRDVEDLECEIKARRHDILAGMPTDEDVKAFGRIGRPPAAAMPVFMCLCRLVFPDEKLKDRNDDDKNWKKLRAYLLRDRNTILDAIQAFDAHAHRARLAELQALYFAEVRPEQFASRRTWATCIAETRPPISDTALARLQAVATFCGRWLKDLPERLEMQDRIEALGEEVKDLQAAGGRPSGGLEIFEARRTNCWRRRSGIAIRPTSTPPRCKRALSYDASSESTPSASRSASSRWYSGPCARRVGVHRPELRRDVVPAAERLLDGRRDVGNRVRDRNDGVFVDLEGIPASEIRPRRSRRCPSDWPRARGRTRSTSAARETRQRTRTRSRGPRRSPASLAACDTLDRSMW